ncbi:MAG: TIGR04255 family protein [Acidimicrobiia bacterium]|nr:TIGR04255 family protein [Acidimicrobiia bacterium]
MADQSPLPEYGRPPVVEVALAVEFKQSVNFSALELGRLANAWADIFPCAEERPLLPRMGLPSEDLLDTLFEIEETASNPPRLWLQNDAGDRVAQVQHDRLVVNWRKSDIGGEYPRYESIRESIRDSWRRLTRASAELGHDEPVPFLCEVQYINHLGAAQGWISPENTARLIVPWRGMGDNNFLTQDYLDGFSLHCHFPKERDGWLTIDGWTSNDSGTKMMTLSLTSRGRALSEDLNTALEFMDTAHAWIVRGFTAVTTPEAHKIWRRTR